MPHVLLFFRCETKKIWDAISIWKDKILLTKLVKKFMRHRLVQPNSLFWIIYQHFGDKINRVLILGFSKDLCPSKPLNSGKLFVLIFGVHRCNLFFSGCPQLFDHFDNLCMRVVSKENGLAVNKLCDNASRRPNINGESIFRVTKNEFWRPIVPWCDVGNTVIVFFEPFGRSKVTDF